VASSPAEYRAIAAEAPGHDSAEGEQRLVEVRTLTATGTTRTCRDSREGGLPVAIWQKFNSRERLTAIGAGLIIIGWLVSLTSFGVGTGVISLLGAIAVLAILYIKYAPNMNVAWPAPVSLLILAISAIVALLALIGLLSLLPYLSLLGFFGGGLLAWLIGIVGAALMVWGAWQEYQIDKPAMPNFGGGMGTRTGTGTTPTAPPTSAPPAPPAAPPADDYNQSPPA
jgi:hypothetical protein